MREYKFRGKPTENNTSYFEDEDFVYGSLIISEDKYYILLDVLDNIKRDDYAVYMVEVRPETIGQYTELKDENGKEIYSGDIIEFSYDMFVGNFDTFVAKGKVVFEEGAFYVEVFENERTTKDEAYLLYSINLDTIEVIGNIYDNPELLEEGE